MAWSELGIWVLAVVVIWRFRRANRRLIGVLVAVLVAVVAISALDASILALASVSTRTSSGSDFPAGPPKCHRYDRRVTFALGPVATGLFDGHVALGACANTTGLEKVWGVDCSPSTNGVLANIQICRIEAADARGDRRVQAAWRVQTGGLVPLSRTVTTTFVVHRDGSFSA